MRSRVEIQAECDEHGRTHLTRLWSEGALGVRRTSEAHVHLVGTAAGPIGADSIEISITVGAGARLSVEGVAATIAQPGAIAGVGQLRQRVLVGDDAQLHLALPALIVTEDAQVQALTEIEISHTAELVLIEQLCLGRFQEDGGQWSGRMIADVGGRPILRQTQSSDSILTAVATRTGQAPVGGAIVSRLVLGPAASKLAFANVYGNAMLAILEAGGTLHTSVGTSLVQAHRDLNELDRINRDTPPLGLAEAFPYPSQAERSPRGGAAR